MSFNAVDVLRLRLPEETDTPDAVLQAELDDAQAALIGDLGFSFDGPSHTVRVDSDGEQELYLPPPGAFSVSLVTDGSTVLESTEWELDPLEGRYLLRLDTNGYPISWVEGRRRVTVRLIPRPCPRDLAKAEVREAVRSWRSRTAGESDVVGVAGTNEVTYVRSFSPLTRTVLDSYKRKFQRSPGMGGA